MSDESSHDLSLAGTTYLRVRALWVGGKTSRRKTKNSQRPGGEPFSQGRDPKTLGDTLSVMTQDLGWSEYLAESLVVQNWADIVGVTLAEHAHIVDISEGVIRVQCDSTAWATELRRMRSQVVSRIQEHYPDAHVEEIKFIAPNAPSWKHGPKSIPGRGPRDTYG